MKKMLKKSDVLREGYVKGLKEAKRIIEERFSLDVPHYDTRVKNIDNMMKNGYFDELVDGLRDDFVTVRSMYNRDGAGAFFDSDIKSVVEDIKGKVVKLKIVVDAIEEQTNDEEWYID